MNSIAVRLNRANALLLKSRNCFKWKHYYLKSEIISNENIKGNAQFIFLCNPPKSSVNVCLMKTYVKKIFKSSSFCNISNFHNGFIWNPSRFKGHFLSELRISFNKYLICNIWFLPLLLMCCLGSNINTVIRLIILQKKWLQIKNFKYQSFHSSPLFSTNNILKFGAKITLKNILFVSKSINRHVP